MTRWDTNQRPGCPEILDSAADGSVGGGEVRGGGGAFREGVDTLDDEE